MKMQKCHYLLKRLALLCAIGAAYVLAIHVSPAVCDDSMAVQLAAESEPDECFYRLGSWDNYAKDADLTTAEQQDCVEQEGTLKRNAGYLWGITKSEDSLWFGTGANIMEAGFGGILDKVTEDRLLSYEHIVPPFRTANTVFELDNSKYMDGELGFLGDYRPPRVFQYNLKTGELTEHTPDDPLLSTTFGLRSAGYLNGVAILAGPVVRNDQGVKGINLFAFDTNSGAFIGSCNIRDMKDDQGNIVAEKVSNIRKWLAVNGVLYTTVGTATGGKVLRWRGSKADPFKFEVIGNLDDQGTELVVHENHLFVLTWPPADDPAGFSRDSYVLDNVCDIMMSKTEIPAGGFTAGTEFVSVWNVRDYEPDYITAATYGLGAVQSWDGYLYWGTMHVPVVATLIYAKEHPTEALTPRRLGRVFLNTNRHAAIFRAKNFASGKPEVELLYGDELMYKYDENARRDKWVAVPNNMGQKPLYGKSGFGNGAVYYTWSMAVYNDQLYVGPVEGAFPEDSDSEIINRISHMINQTFMFLPDAMDETLRDSFVDIPEATPGTDIFRFPSSNSPAEAITTDCFGRYGAYGIRNMIVADGSLYMGTASSFPLHRTGGWALIKITTPDPNPQY